jgi:hypothetical protein
MSHGVRHSSHFNYGCNNGLNIEINMNNFYISMATTKLEEYNSRINTLSQLERSENLYRSQQSNRNINNNNNS